MYYFVRVYVRERLCVCMFKERESVRTFVCECVLKKERQDSVM